MAAESNALIVCFGSAHTAGKVTAGEARNTVKSRDVKIIKSDIIYQILEDVKTKVGEEYLPKIKGQDTLGKGKLLKVFSVNTGRNVEEDLVAGSKVISGKFVVNYNVHDKNDDSVAKYVASEATSRCSHPVGGQPPVCVGNAQRACIVLVANSLRQQQQVPCRQGR